MGQAGAAAEGTAVLGEPLAHDCLECFGKAQGPCPRASRGLGSAQPPHTALPQPQPGCSAAGTAQGCCRYSWAWGRDKGRTYPDKPCLGELLAKQRLLEKELDDVVL